MRSESSTAALPACFSSSSLLDGAEQVRAVAVALKERRDRERKERERAQKKRRASQQFHCLSFKKPRRQPPPPSSPSLTTNNQKQAGQRQPLPVVVRTANLRDLTPTDKAKVSRLLRRVLHLSADNERLASSAAAAAAAREGEAAELRRRLGAALDSLAEARRRAESAEARLRAAEGSCVCGAAAGAVGKVKGARGGGEEEGEGGGEEERENRENFFGRSSTSNAPPPP